MRISRLASQRGLSFTGFLLGAFIFVLVSMFAMHLIPAYMENAEINKILADIAKDPDMQKATAKEIRASFNSRALIDTISSINGGDLVIDNKSGKLVLSASYYVKTPLVGNVSLYLDFNPSSAGR
ncbi:MAG: DUF4845 domain-containing protein [Gallionella sp.]|nr:DUF4845 domain-containing protein [Gallionella sp.]